MQLLFYRVLTAISAPLAALVFLVRGDGLARVRERLGLVPRTSSGSLWFHAASVGEFRALRPLILREWGMPVVVTVQSRQGQALARRELPATIPVLAAPLDAPLCFPAFLDRVQPRALVLVESELWPGWLASLQARSVPAVLIDGALSKSSARRWAGWGGLVQPMAGGLHRITVSSPSKKAVFEELGFQRVELALPLKLAGDPLPIDEDLVKSWQAWQGYSPLVVLSNVHPSEIPALKEMLETRTGDEKVIIAPRYPEQLRAFEVAFGGANDQLAYWKGFGTLGALYALGGTVVIGGGFDAKIGSHNPLEALRAGCQVVCGPFPGKQSDVLDLLRARGLVAQFPEWPKAAIGADNLDDLAAKSIKQAVSAVESVISEQ